MQTNQTMSRKMQSIIHKTGSNNRSSGIKINTTTYQNKVPPKTSTTRKITNADYQGQ